MKKFTLRAFRWHLLKNIHSNNMYYCKTKEESYRKITKNANKTLPIVTYKFTVA